MKAASLKRMNQVYLSISITLFLTFSIDMMMKGNYSFMDRKQRNLNQMPINAYTEWDRGDLAFPCARIDEPNPIHGMNYVFIPSTTNKGVTVSKRIAALDAKDMGLKGNKTCRVNVITEPITSFDSKVSTRNKKKAFLWSIGE